MTAGEFRRRSRYFSLLGVEARERGNEREKVRDIAGGISREIYKERDRDMSVTERLPNLGPQMDQEEIERLAVVQ